VRPALRNHVGHVVAVRSDEQVIGTNAFAIVASVEHEQSISHWTVAGLPRHAVS
jgi:hypothetical protein